MRAMSGDDASVKTGVLFISYMAATTKTESAGSNYACQRENVKQLGQGRVEPWKSWPTGEVTFRSAIGTSSGQPTLAVLYTVYVLALRNRNDGSDPVSMSDNKHDMDS